MKRIFILSAMIAMVLVLSVQAQAILTTIGQAQYGGQNYNLIYDNDSPFGAIVWLDYTNSWTNWEGQKNWAAGLNTAGVLTYNLNPGVTVTWSGDWRLPSTVDGDCVYGYKGPESDGSYTYTYGYNLYNSEMGHLYYTELGNLGRYDTSRNYVGGGNWGLLKTGDFQNLQQDVYWSGTEYAADPDYAWYSDFYHGLQDVDGKFDYYALAVRPGDVAAVPEPGTLLLLGSGIVGLAAFRKRFRRRDR